MNNKSARLALIVISSALFLSASTSLVTATTVAHWKFEEGPVGGTATGDKPILDSSGNNLHGTPYGGPIYENVSNPNSNLALKFDGSDDRLYIPDNELFQLTEQFTLEAFIRIDALTFPSGFHDVILIRDLGAPNIDPYVLTLWNDGHLIFGVSDETAAYIHLRSPSPLPVGEFIHIAGSYNSGVMKLYINGVEVSSLTTTIVPAATISNPPNPPGLGIANTAWDGPVHPGYNHSFNGAIDEVRISDVALDPSEFLTRVHIACIGFEYPMDQPFTLVGSKKRRVFPLKMSLVDELGSPIIDTDIASPPVVQESFTNNFPETLPYTYSSPLGEADEGNEFIFRNGKWELNIPANNFSAPGTYTIRAIPGDSSEYTINPTCEATFVIPKKEGKKGRGHK